MRTAAGPRRMRASHGVEAEDGIVAIADAELCLAAELLVHDETLSSDKTNRVGCLS